MIKPRHILWITWASIIAICTVCGFKARGQSETYTIDQVIECLILVEESEREEYGDNGMALGKLQIHPIMVREANRLLGRAEFSLEDRTNPSRSKNIARVFIIEQIRRYRLKYKKLPPIVILSGSWQTGAIEIPARPWYYKKAKKAWYNVKNKEV